MWIGSSDENLLTVTKVTPEGTFYHCEECCLLGCDAVQSGRKLLARFQDYSVIP